MVELVLRLVFSLAVVLGMVLVLAKLSSQRFRGSSEALVRVVHRQPLSRGSAVAVVTVGGRVLVLGATDQRVDLLTELDPGELDLDVDEPAAVPTAAPTGHSAAGPADRPAFAPVLEAALRDRAQPQPPAPGTRIRGRSGGRHARPAESPLAGLRSRSSKPGPVPGASPLAGSVLSAQTWKQAFAAVSGKAQNAS